jgi:hypothetical protein|tara:strand:- start:120 stop:605 length:486 start_codon:yes stop_codon:yes gene_type:complete
MTNDPDYDQIRGDALDRIKAQLDLGWCDIDGPMLVGLDADGEVINEMQRITDEIRDRIGDTPSIRDVWEAVTGGFCNYSWWEEFRFEEGDWDEPGVVVVTIENPMGGESITKRLTALDIWHTYRSMPHQTHCGECNLITDPDACSFDLVLQTAMLGEITYG